MASRDDEIDRTVSAGGCFKFSRKTVLHDFKIFSRFFGRTFKRHFKDVVFWHILKSIESLVDRTIKIHNLFKMIISLIQIISRFESAGGIIDIVIFI